MQALTFRDVFLAFLTGFHVYFNLEIFYEP
jgi:hypothetical protein